jgi:hypothetical protein
VTLKTGTGNQRSSGALSFSEDQAVILLRSRAGNVIKALTSSRSAVTVMPNKRNGSNKNQTMGYSKRARRAKGQQRTKRIHQSKNLSI